MTFFTPLDLRFVDPRPEQVAADTAAAAVQAVRSRLGDDADDVLAALGLAVAS